MADVTSEKILLDKAPFRLQHDGNFIHGVMMAKPTLICSTCGTIGQPVTTTPGSFVMELFLWLLMILPGLIYSIWRLSNKKTGCARCGGTALIPMDSPRGQKLVLEFKK